MSAKKRAKTAAADESTIEIPSSIIVNFANGEGVRAGPQVGTVVATFPFIFCDEYHRLLITDIPVSSSVKQLELLLNSLLQKESSPLPYAFYVNDIEVTNTVEETLKQIQQLKVEASSSDEKSKKSKLPEDSTASALFSSFEDTITISYQPLSVFKVRPVTRCVEVSFLLPSPLYIINSRIYLLLHNSDDAWTYGRCTSRQLFSRRQKASFWWRRSRRTPSPPTSYHLLEPFSPCSGALLERHHLHALAYVSGSQASCLVHRVDSGQQALRVGGQKRRDQDVGSCYRFHN